MVVGHFAYEWLDCLQGSDLIELRKWQIWLDLDQIVGCASMSII